MQEIFPEFSSNVFCLEEKMQYSFSWFGLSVNTLGHKMRIEGHKGTIFCFIDAEK